MTDAAAPTSDRQVVGSGREAVPRPDTARASVTEQNSHPNRTRRARTRVITTVRAGFSALSAARIVLLMFSCLSATALVAAVALTRATSSGDAPSLAAARPEQSPLDLWG